MFKLIENKENVAEIAQSLLNDKLCQINFASVAEAAGSTVDTVLATLAGIRDEIIDSVFLRKLNVQLDFGIGRLLLFNNSTIQFKSDARPVSRLDERPDEIPGSKDFEDIKPVKGVDKRTARRKSAVFEQEAISTFDAQRSIIHMQNTQAN